MNTIENGPRVAVVCHGDSRDRRGAVRQAAKFDKVLRELTAQGAMSQAVLYSDEGAEEARKQLLGMDAVLVWVNPIEDGHDRSKLDGLLRELSASGIYVSAHPDVILRMGTKEILYLTRDMGWGTDVRLYRTLSEFSEGLKRSLEQGVRVVKQYRGQSGAGVWRVQKDGASHLRVRHAERGCVEERMPFDSFIELCAAYFKGEGRLVDQAWQHRLPEGMTRCYLVGDTVQGFGVQDIVALHPGAEGCPPEEAPLPTPRLYHGPAFPPPQPLKRKLEAEWVPELLRLTGLDRRDLPALWDCDFLLGPRTADGQDSYVLCEINVSSVSPFPDSAAARLARMAIERGLQARRSRAT